MDRILLEAEAQRRTELDGIPRFVTDEGQIMKCDWQMSEEDSDIDFVSLEEHIQRLLDEQS